MSAKIPRFVHAVTAEHIHRSSAGAIDWRYSDGRAREARAEAAGGGLRRLGRALGRLWRQQLAPALAAARTRSATRRELRRLDEATLKDIGVAPQAIESAARAVGRQAAARVRRGRAGAGQRRGWRQRPGGQGAGRREAAGRDPQGNAE